MFKKLINHDKSSSKLKNGNSDSTSTDKTSDRGTNSNKNGDKNNNINGIVRTKTLTRDSLRKQEKETTQHVENATDIILESDSPLSIPVVVEDAQDLVPFTDDPNLPFGDGSNKIFGMENFGNTCYCNSVLQVLYYTTTFRRAILAFPERDPDHFRRRRLNVPGEKTHAFVQLQYNQTGLLLLLLPGSLDHVVEEEAKPEKRRTSIFGMPKMSKPNGSSSSNGTVPPSSSGSTATVTTNSSFANNGVSELNSSNSALNNPHLIDKNIANKYPALKSIKPMYQLNQQRTLSILGDTEDASANTEKRKRQLLIQGPIINLDHLYNDTYGMQRNLFTTLKDIFECMVENKSQTGVVSPQKLIEVLKEENELFRSSMHQDAHEFLNFLINSVLEVVDNYNMDGPKSPELRNLSTTSSEIEKKAIHEIFEGLLTSETQCLCCERTSTRDEKFLDLSIDLTSSSSITRCLKQFSQSEMLQEQNKFYCDSCHSLQEAAKTIRLKKSPKILALHLKRFKYSEEYNRNMKLFHRVTYPKNLRLFNTTADTETPDKLYQLYAVVVHIGGGPHHGHYISLIKTENFGWLLFDDEVVESIDENYVYRFFGDGPGLATAYVLFYKELDELSNIHNNLFDGFDLDNESQNSTTLDMNFNQMTGHLNERLMTSLQFQTPNESISDSKRSDENSGESNYKMAPSSASSFFESDPLHLIPPSGVPTQLQQTQPPPTLGYQLRKMSTSGNSNEKRKSKMFGWKKN